MRPAISDKVIDDLHRIALTKSYVVRVSIRVSRYMIMNECSSKFYQKEEMTGTLVTYVMTTID